MHLTELPIESQVHKSLAKVMRLILYCDIGLYTQGDLVSELGKNGTCTCTVRLGFGSHFDLHIDSGSHDISPEVTHDL